MMKMIRRLFGKRNNAGHTTEDYILPEKPSLNKIYAARLAVEMPTEKEALRQICQAQDRLKSLGWVDGVYAPKTGEEFEALEIGSVGVFKAYYEKHLKEFIWWDGESSEFCGEPFMFKLIKDNDEN